jgi:hypothetical protein
MPTVSAQQILWSQTIFGHEALGSVEALAVDSSGVYVGGQRTVQKYALNGTPEWTRSTFDVNEWVNVRDISAFGGSVYVTGDGLSADLFVSRLDVSGKEIWTVQTARNLDNEARAISVDASGVYVVGDLDFAGDSEALIYSYDHNGVERCHELFGTNGPDHAAGVAVHSTGVYVAGTVVGAGTSGDALPGAIVTGNTPWIFVRKYDSNCNVIWTRQFGHSPDGTVTGNFGKAIAVDDSGVYVAGTRNADGFVRKFDFNGDDVWTAQFGLPGSEVLGISVHASGVYVAGDTGGFAAIVRKYDVNGNFVWERRFFGPGDSRANGISVDDSGVYVARGSLTDIEGFTRKYDLNGIEVWTRPFAVGTGSEASGIAAHAAAVYVTGTGSSLTGPGSGGAFVRKYGASGNEVWTRQFDISDRATAHAIAVDGSGVYVAGQTGGILPGQIGSGGEDAFIRKYDTSGNEVWTQQFGGPDQDSINAIFVGASGVYVAGSMEKNALVRQYGLNGNEILNLVFGTASADGAFAISVDATGIYVAGGTSGTLPGQVSAGNTDAFVRKYDFNGNALWTHQFGTRGFDGATGVAVDASGVYLAGIQGIGLGGEESYVRKYSVDGDEIWTRLVVPSIPDPTLMISAAGVSGLSVDSSGVYVAGAVLGTFPGQTSAGGVDAFVGKYDIDGNEVWIFQFGTGDTNDRANAVAVDASVVYVAGSMLATGFVARLVPDTMPPTITAPANITASNAPGQCSVVVNFTFTAADDSGSVTVTSSPGSGSTFPKGVTTVTGTATDSAGNTATATFTVTVNDTEPPAITAPANVTVGTGPGSTTAGAVVSDAMLGAASASDNCAGVTLARSGVPAGNFFLVGTTTVTYTATDAAGNTASTTQTVTVIDTTPPAVTVPVDIIAEATGPSGAIVNYTASANDNVDGTLTPICTPASGSTFPLGATAVTCSTADGAGNTGSGAFNVVVRDTTPPVLSGVPGDFTKLTPSATGAVVNYALPSAADSVDPSPTVTCSPPSGSTLPVGPSPVTCTASDAAGNSSAAVFTVTVLTDIDTDGTPDVADPCPSDPTNTCDPGGSTAEIVDSETGGTLTTPDGTVSVTIPPGSLPQDTTISITNTGSTYELTTNLGQALGVFGVDIQPAGTTFNPPITIVFSWSDVDDDGLVDGTNVREENLRITKDNVAITDKCKDEPTRCDTSANTFTITVSSLSEFVVIGPLDADGDGVFNSFEGQVDACPTEDSTGFDANRDGCIDTLSGLISVLNVLVTSGVIAPELQTSLLSKLENAQKSASKENICAAVNELRAFKNQIEAQRGKKVSDEAANLLMEYAQNIIASHLKMLPPGESC